jgi:NAD(P)-dependent dehydrogenase (short-subunit alcohol dehydrogenase family)
MAFRSGPVAPGVAFVTGGARGLGNAIGVSFAKEGARGVCLVDIQDEATFEEGKKAVEKHGAKVITHDLLILVVLKPGRSFVSVPT